MEDFEVTGEVSSVVFVKTKIFSIDRGWDPADVIALLNSEGFETRVVVLETLEELHLEINQNPYALFWPACYTLSGDERGILISEVFEKRKVRFVGASSASLRFSSKIQFKRALDPIVGVRTPEYQLLDQAGIPLASINLGYPLMLKTEYSCNSEGVRKIESSEDFNAAFSDLSTSYGQRMYVERWERVHEYTAAFIPSVGGRGELIAPVGMRILSGASFIDVPTKAESPLVEIIRLDRSEVSEIQNIVRSLIQALSIDGHCRIDLLRNSLGQLFVIEANFEPFMSISERKRSYFPNALHKELGIEFRDQIAQIIEHAVNRRLA